MTTQLTDIKLSKSITLRTRSPYGWFFSKNSSIKSLYNIAHRTLAIVIPDADCHLSINIKSKAIVPSEIILKKEYASFCQKHNIKNIFA